MTQKTKVRLIVPGVLVLAAALFVSGVFNPNRYLLVRNESEDGFRRGCCTKLIIGGSSEAGYTLAVDGFANWLIPQVEDLL